MSKLAAAALVVSLAFNAMFAVGYFTARTTAAPERDGKGTPDVVAAKLGLNDAQRQQFSTLWKEYQTKAQELRQAAQLAQEQLWLESSDPDSDPQRIEQLKNDLFDLHHARRELELAQFNDFLELLTPEQRQRAHQRLRRPHCPPRWGPRLRRFDQDHNGALGPEERERALHHLRQRARGFRRRGTCCPSWGQRRSSSGPAPRRRGRESPPAEQGPAPQRR